MHPHQIDNLVCLLKKKNDCDVPYQNHFVMSIYGSLCIVRNSTVIIEVVLLIHD